MKNPSPFRYFKTSPEIIRLAAMLSVRFPLLLRDFSVELADCVQLGKAQKVAQLACHDLL